MYRFIKIVIFTLLLLYFNPLLSQDKDTLLVNDAKTLVQQNPLSYNEIDAKLKKYKSDSTKVSYLIRFFAQNDYPPGESYVLNALGVHCRNTSQYAEAIKYHQQALAKAITAENLEGQINSLNMLGVVYRRLDMTRSALDYHYDALSLAEEIENPSEFILGSIAVSLNSMGNIYLVLSQYDLAIEKFTKSLSIEKSLNNTLGLAINYANLGFAKESLGNLDLALEDYKMSLKYNEAINSLLGKVICNNSIGKILIKQGKYNEGLNIILPTLEIAKTLRDKFHLSGVYNNIGWAYAELKQFESAKAYLIKGLNISEQHNFKSAMVEAYEHLSRMSEDQDNFEESLMYYKAAQEIKTEITNENNFKYVNDIIIKYDTEKINTKNQVLEKENEIVRTKLRTNKTILFVSSIILCLVVIVIYNLYKKRLLQNEKKMLTQEQAMLRSQMNPHFIFNSLNSIKHYIITNEQKNAVSYLNKFAKLIRKILDLSQVKEVSLANELETLELYMSIENIRFSNDIDFQILVDNDLNLEVIKLPSLVLQPFLENAIWHGLSSKNGDKTIRIYVKNTSKNYVTIIIEDNGIGREKAKQISRNKVIKRKSIGVALSKNRLSNFGKGFRNSFSLVFTDLKDHKNNALGTRVVLQIPLV